MLFRKFAALLSGRTATASKPAPELESAHAFRAHLLARGLSPQEASDMIVDRTCTAIRYWQAKGYATEDCYRLGGPRLLGIPTGKADRELYYECRRSRHMAERFGLHHYRAG
jgi:hypothetical protein